MEDHSALLEKLKKEKEGQRAALKAAQMALDNVADEKVGDAFSAVEKVIAEFRSASAPKAHAPAREEKSGRDRMERSGQTRSE